MVCVLPRNPPIPLCFLGRRLGKDDSLTKWVSGYSETDVAQQIDIFQLNPLKGVNR